MSRSDEFRAQVEQIKSLNPGEVALLDEACRLLDRLDRFDAMLAGDASEWATIDWPYEDAPARLVIGSVVTEARQHVAELRQVVGALKLPQAKAKTENPSKLELLLGGKATG